MVKFVTTMEIIQLAVIFSVIFTANGNEVDVSAEGSVSVRPTEEADLSCSTDVDIRYCTFTSPNGENYNVAPGDVYENRISFLGEDAKKDCGIKIKNVRESDNGVWKCEITSLVSGAARKGSNTISLNVLKAPNSVSLDSGAMLNMVFKQDAEKTVKCTAAGGQPAPSFSWTLDGEPVNLKVVAEDQESTGDAVVAYQEVAYVPKPEDDGKKLTCVANSQAYTAGQLEAGENTASTELEVQYAPTSQKDTYDFYGMNVGQKFDIRISFRMNPAPTEVTWHMNGLEVPSASESEGGAYNAARVVEGPTEKNQYTAVLTINSVSDKDAGTKHKLVVKNDFGEETIHFNLAMGEKPPTEAGTGPVIAIVIIILVIIVVVAVFVVARSQGLLCFAAKDGMPDAEKGKFEALEKEDTTPEKEPENVVKSDPESKAAVEAETEEKKSNGASSPAK